MEMLSLKAVSQSVITIINSFIINDNNCQLQPNRLHVVGGVRGPEHPTGYKSPCNISNIRLEAPVQSQEDSHRNQMIYTTAPGEREIYLCRYLN